MPSEIPIIDLMLGLPSEEAKRSYDFMRPLFKDKQSLESFDFPVEYMFKDVPRTAPGAPRWAPRRGKKGTRRPR